MKRRRTYAGEAAKARAHKAMELRHALPHMSHSALAAFVMFAKEHDVSDLGTSRAFYWDSRDQALPYNEYGSILFKVSLTAKPGHANKDMFMINPFAMLQAAFSERGGFSELLSNMLREKPPSQEAPWRITLYADEVVPGNQLSVQNKRKAWVLYWSFLEFGKHLGNESAWLPLVAETSHGLKHISGGISQVFAVAIKQFFGVGTLAFNFMTAGMLLANHDGSFKARLIAILPMILQDGGAHKAVFWCKGDSGTKFCMLCVNLVALKSELTASDGTRLLKCSVVHEEDLAFATNSDIRGAIRRLQAHKLTDSPKVFKKREQAIGFTYQEHGLLQDPSLETIVNPADVYCHDWMHGMMVGGASAPRILLTELLQNLLQIPRALDGLWIYAVHPARPGLIEEAPASGCVGGSFYIKCICFCCRCLQHRSVPCAGNHPGYCPSRTSWFQCLGESR